jgi:hypothetical protein
MNAVARIAKSSRASVSGNTAAEIRTEGELGASNNLSGSDSSSAANVSSTSSTPSTPGATVTTLTKSNPLEMAVNTGDFTEARFVLFNNTPEDREEGKVYPIMRGAIEAKHFKIDIGAFTETSKDNVQYLSLSIGSNGQEKVYGRFFRDTVIGKEGHYYGYIEKAHQTGVDGEGKKVYEVLWTLPIDAKRTQSESGVKYISGKVYTKGNKKVAAAAQELKF